MQQQMSSATKKSREQRDLDDPDLFKGVVFFLNDSLAQGLRDALEEVLCERGGVVCPASTSTSRFDRFAITHFITDTLDFLEYPTLRPNGEPQVGGEVEADVHIVTPAWVTRSQDAQKQLSTVYYSADKALFFSGLCFCTSDLPDSDSVAIRAGVISLGGQYRRELTREVTHLFVIAPDGAKYESAMRYGPELAMVCLLPHWFEECLKLRQLVPTDIYQFPNPPLTEISEWTSKKPFHERLVDWRRANPNGRPTKVRATTFTASILGNALTAGSKTREAYLKTAIVHCEREQIAPPRGAATGSGLYGADSLGTGSSSALPSGSRSNSGLWPPPSTMPTSENAIFSGRSVYLASDLALRPGLEEALKARVEAAGGTCWSWGVDGQRDNGDQWERRRKGEKALAAANTVVTRKREGWEFWHAYDQGKMIGNLPWMYHVLASSKLDSPLDHLLHYPSPPGSIAGFEGKSFTVSNYTGSAREYVRTLIETCGGTFRGDMARDTNYVVSASDVGSKYAAGVRWNIPIVNHLWLEACLLAWSFVNPLLDPAYVTSSGTLTNYCAIVGQTSLPRGKIDAWAKDETQAAQRALALIEMDTSGEAVKMDEDEVDELEVETEETRETEAEEVSEVLTALAPISPLQDVTFDEEVTMDDPPVPQVSIQIDDGGGESAVLVEQSYSSPVRRSPIRSPIRPPTQQSTAKATPIRRPFPDLPSSDEQSIPPPAPPAPRRLQSTPPPLPPVVRAPITPQVVKAPHPPSTPAEINVDNILPPSRPGRGAAAAAKSRLGTMMADAIVFEKEQKMSAQKKKSGKRSVHSESEDEEEESRAGPSKKRVERPDFSEDEESESSMELPPKKAKLLPPPLAKTVVGMSGVESTDASGAVSSFDAPPHPKKVVVARGGGNASKTKAIRILASGFFPILDKDTTEFKQLTKLGNVKWTDKPSEVTHLVVNKIMRTEKFLTCLAFAPFIVTRDWITKSIKAKVLLDEEPFLLHDVEKEKVMGDTLADILDRARAGKLFAGMTIYTTPRVHPDQKTLVNIIQCGGGTASTVKLSVGSTQERIANDPKSHVVSSPDDRKEWNTLAAKKRISIYSVEAVFESVLHQRLLFLDKDRIDLQVDR